MNLFGMIETSGGAMQAERMRAEVVAANMANAETTRTPTGGPYHRQHVIFSANPGDPAFANTLNAASGNAAFGSALGGSTASSAMTAGADGTEISSSTGSAPPPLLPLLTPLSSLHMSGTQPTAPGVQIAGVVEDPSPPLKRYDPGHPDAGPDGYVSYPDINPLTEMVDLMGATRAYGLNSSAVQAEKSMITSALEIAKS